MKNSSQIKIVTFKDLKAAERSLSDKIREQEKQLLNHPLVTVPASIFQGRSFKSTLKSSMDSISIEQWKKTAMNLVSTALMANKRTRKFFVAFIIAKEMVPFILEKVNEHVKKT